MSDKICNTPAVDRLFSESGYIGGVPDIMREMNWSMFELCTDVLMTILQASALGALLKASQDFVVGLFGDAVFQLYMRMRGI